MGFGQTQRFGHFFGHLVDLNANPTPRNPAVRTQLIADPNRLVDGDRKSNPHVPPRARINLAVDAHHFTAHIDQWATRVTRVDRHIGLNEGQVIARVAAFGTDNARRDRVFQTEGRTNRNHPLADAHFADIAHLDGRQPSGLDFDHGHVGAFVGANQFGFEFALIGQGHQQLIRAIDHMGIGQDIPVGGQDEARSNTFGLGLVIGIRHGLARTPLGHFGHRNAKTTEKFLHVSVGDIALCHGVGRRFFEVANVDHRGADLLHQVGEVGQATPIVGLNRRCCVSEVRQCQSRRRQQATSRQHQTSESAGPLFLQQRALRERQTIQSRSHCSHRNFRK